MEEANLNKSIVNAFKIIDQIASSDSKIGVSELSRLTKLPKTNIFRLTHTLEELGIIVSDDFQQYSLGNKFLSYVDKTKTKNSLVEIAEPYMQKFASEVKEGINLGIMYEQSEVVFLKRVRGDYFQVQVDLIPISPLYCSSVGKIFLSEFSNDQIDKYFENTKFIKRTVNTITDKSQMMRQLEEIKKAHVSYDREEYEYGLSCISVPIYHHGKVIAGISVSGPTSRLKVRGIDLIRSELIKTGEKISQTINLNLK